MRLKNLIIAAAAAVLSLTAAPAAHAQVLSSDQAFAQECRAHYLIAVPGGGNTIPGVPTWVPHGGNVFSTGLLSQARSGGAIQPVWVSYQSTPFATMAYPQAFAGGYARVSDTVAGLANRCPGARFSFTGFSLGADIAAQLTSDIAHGRGPIPADRVASVALFSNPHQGGNGAVAASTTDPASRGALGSLNDGFGELGGRVLEICHPNDYICSLPEHYRAAVDPAMAINLIAGQVPAAELSSQGLNVIDLAQGFAAHGGYWAGDHLEAVNWIVSHA